MASDGRGQVDPVDAREVSAAVARALAGEAPLEEVVSELLFGEFDPQHPVWPPEAQRVWLLAVWEFERVRTRRMDGEGGARSREPHPPTSMDVYSAFHWLAPNPSRWWHLPGVKWSDLGGILGVSMRAAQYHVRERLGFVLEGAGEGRRVVEGPCLACGRPVAVQELEALRCPWCRSRRADSR